MSGLTDDGLEIETYVSIRERIGRKLKLFSSGIDLSEEAMDGQMLSILSFELSSVWASVGAVYNSGNPNLASGLALKNMCNITGTPFKSATNSYTRVTLTGVAGTFIKAGSSVSNDDGDVFKTSFDATIPATVTAVASIAGLVSVAPNSITTIVDKIDGWDNVVNSTTGVQGQLAQTDLQLRNQRTKTVLRNYTSNVDTIKGMLLEELDIHQCSIVANSSNVTSNGVPPETIHVSVGEVGLLVTDLQIAEIIAKTKGLMTKTHGSTTVVITDSEDNDHSISFTKAVAKPIFLKVDVTFLDSDNAGAPELIKESLLTIINGLETGDNVVWSRLFAPITQHSEAQINSLELSYDGVTYVSTNLALTKTEYAFIELGSIVITVTK